MSGCSITEIVDNIVPRMETGGKNPYGELWGHRT